MTMVATLGPRAVVRVAGDDATSYLQGQISQDLDAVAIGGHAWSLVLDPSGRFVALFRLHRVGADEYLLDTEPGSAEPLVARLRRFVLRTAVTITEEPGWTMLSVRGPDPGDVAVPDGAILAPVDWPGFAGFDVLGPELTPPDGVGLDDEAFEAARIAAGVPRSGVDLDDDTIPAEGGQALIDATVSFTKGCFTGQELVARIDSRGGNVPRPLRVVRGDGPLTLGATVVHDGTPVGEVTSAAGDVALARVARKVEPGTGVEVDGVAATVSAPGP